VDALYEAASAWLFWVVTRPGVLPLIALAVLVFGLRHARRVGRPIRYRFGVIVTAAAFVCFSLIPTYGEYVHTRGVKEEWFWQALGLVVPFVLLGLGLNIMTSARKTSRDQHFWHAP